MPMEWVPAPSNQSLPVLKEELKNKPSYHCGFCKGWIEGVTNDYHEDDLGPLCGRKGIVSYCARCGNEIGFSGMVS